MTYDEKSRIYTADEKKMFVRKSDGRIFGDALQLGQNDTIDNYEEREFSEEERAAFWESVGIDDPKKAKGKYRKKSEARRGSDFNMDGKIGRTALSSKEIVGIEDERQKY